MKLSSRLGTVLLSTVVVVACSSTTQPLPAPAPGERVESTQASLSIPGLFGTGVSAAGTVLADGAVDPHYALTASGDPQFPPGSTFVVNSTVYPVVGAWAADSATSKWISVQSGNSADAQPTNFAYTTTFTLANVDPTTASIKGTWGCDNSCSITLNGTLIALTSPSFATLEAFTIPLGSPFVSGTNTLTFIVTNAPAGANPTGLRVDGIVGTAGCAQDAQCPNGQWCNNVSASPGACQPTIANGSPVTGSNCNATAGSAPGTVGSRACTSGACDTSDNLCGLANGDGQCSSGVVCRSSVCDPAAGGGTGRCEQCTKTNTSNCSAGAPICDSSTETCVSCNGDNGAAATADCLAAAPYCPGGGGACTTCGAAGQPRPARPRARPTREGSARRAAPAGAPAWRTAIAPRRSGAMPAPASRSS